MATDTQFTALIKHVREAYPDEVVEHIANEVAGLSSMEEKLAALQKYVHPQMIKALNERFVEGPVQKSVIDSTFTAEGGRGGVGVVYKGSAEEASLNASMAGKPRTTDREFAKEIAQKVHSGELTPEEARETFRAVNPTKGKETVADLVNADTESLAEGTVKAVKKKDVVNPLINNKGYRQYQVELDKLKNASGSSGAVGPQGVPVSNKPTIVKAPTPKASIAAVDPIEDLVQPTSTLRGSRGYSAEAMPSSPVGAYVGKPVAPKGIPGQTIDWDAGAAASGGHPPVKSDFSYQEGPNVVGPNGPQSPYKGITRGPSLPEEEMRALGYSAQAKTMPGAGPRKFAPSASQGLPRIPGPTESLGKPSFLGTPKGAAEGMWESGRDVQRGVSATGQAARAAEVAGVGAEEALIPKAGMLSKFKGAGKFLKGAGKLLGPIAGAVTAWQLFDLLESSSTGLAEKQRIEKYQDTREGVQRLYAGQEEAEQEALGAQLGRVSQNRTSVGLAAANQQAVNDSTLEMLLGAKKTAIGAISQRYTPGPVEMVAAMKALSGI